MAKTNEAIHSTPSPAWEIEGYPGEVDVLIASATRWRNTDAAFKLLRVASASLRTGAKLDSGLALYLADAFDAILANVAPVQALHLKANARKGASPDDLIRIFFRVAFLMRSLPNKTAAIRQYAMENGIKFEAAQKRYRAAARTAGRVYEDLLAMAAKRALSPPPLGAALMGENAGTPVEGMSALALEFLGGGK